MDARVADRRGKAKIVEEEEDNSTAEDETSHESESESASESASRSESDLEQDEASADRYQSLLDLCCDYYTQNLKNILASEDSRDQEKGFRIIIAFIEGNEETADFFHAEKELKTYLNTQVINKINEETFKGQDHTRAENIASSPEWQESINEVIAARQTINIKFEAFDTKATLFALRSFLAISILPAHIKTLSDFTNSACMHYPGIAPLYNTAMRWGFCSAPEALVTFAKKIVAFIKTSGYPDDFDLLNPQADFFAELEKLQNEFYEIHKTHVGNDADDDIENLFDKLIKSHALLGRFHTNPDNARKQKWPLADATLSHIKEQCSELSDRDALLLLTSYDVNHMLLQALLTPPQQWSEPFRTVLTKIVALMENVFEVFDTFDSEYKNKQLQFIQQLKWLLTVSIKGKIVNVPPQPLLFPCNLNNTRIAKSLSVIAFLEKFALDSPAADWFLLSGWTLDGIENELLHGNSDDQQRLLVYYLLLNSLAAEKKCDFAAEKLLARDKLSHILPHLPTEYRFEFSSDHKEKISDDQELYAVLLSLDIDQRLAFANDCYHIIKDSQQFLDILASFPETQLSQQAEFVAKCKALVQDGYILGDIIFYFTENEEIVETLLNDYKTSIQSFLEIIHILQCWGTSAQTKTNTINRQFDFVLKNTQFIQDFNELVDIILHFSDDSEKQMDLALKCHTAVKSSKDLITLFGFFSNLSPDLEDKKKNLANACQNVIHTQAELNQVLCHLPKAFQLQFKTTCSRSVELKTHIAYCDNREKNPRTYLHWYSFLFGGVERQKKLDAAKDVIAILQSETSNCQVIEKLEGLARKKKHKSALKQGTLNAMFQATIKNLNNLEEETIASRLSPRKSKSNS